MGRLWNYGRATPTFSRLPAQFGCRPTCALPCGAADKITVPQATFFVAHQTTDATRVFHKVIKHSMQASDAHFYWVDVFCSRVLYTVVDDDDN